jgi:large subunit ribosomal protein L16
MLIPRRVKHRKQHHPGRSGAAKGGTAIAFGDYGIQALEPAYVTNRQIESARIAMTRHIKRGGKVWINIYPDRPITKKPAETRMGSGKGSPEWWVANVKPGRVMFELSGVPEPIAKEAMRRAMHKLPMKCKFVRREEGACSAGNKLAVSHRGLDDDELVTKLREAKEELFNLRFQAATGQLESHGRLRAVRKDIARIYTVMRERELGISTVETTDEEVSA